MRGKKFVLACAFVLPISASVYVLPVSADSGGSVTGKLVNGDSGNDAPAAGVQIQACTAAGCAPAVTSDANGNYTMTNLSAQSWTLVTNVVQTCSPGDYARSEIGSVSVPSGGTITAPLLRLTHNKGTLAGHVYLAGTTTPIGGALVTGENEEQGGDGFNQSTTLTSGDVGYYQINCLPAERGYFLDTTPPSPYSTQLDSQFTVTAGQTYFHDIYVTQGSAQIDGFLKCGGGPCSGFEVLAGKICGLGTAGPNGCSDWSGRTNSDGFFDATGLTAGTYTVHVFSQPGWDQEAWFNVNVATNNSTVPMGNLDIQQSNSGSSGRIQGTINDAAGAPYSTCRINIFNQAPNPSIDNGQGFISGIGVDTSGHYDTGYALAPGSLYRVYIDCDGRNEVQVGTNPDGSNLTIGSGQTAEVDWTWGEPQRPYTGGSDAIGLPQAGTDAYFAEGFTGINDGLSFHEYLTLQNPNTAAENVNVDYLLSTGAVITKTYGLAGQSRTTVNVNQEVGPFQNVSAHVHCTAPCSFVAERPMYFNFPGVGDGGDVVMGAQNLGTTFYFAEGYTGPGFREFLTLMNPDQNTPASVQVTYYYDGGGSKTMNYTVGTTTRATVDVNADSGCTCGVAMTVRMTSGPAAGILAERPMYFNYQGRTGGDVVVGTQTLGTSLNLAEGFVSPNFNEYLTILNPNAATAYVAINYLTDKQGVVIKNVVVPGNSRFTEKVDNDLNQYISSSVNITSNVGIAVERPMYFNFNGWTGGHDAMAVPDSALGMTFNFAEGFVSPNFAEYYTFENNNSGVALVSVRFLLTGGGVITKSLAVAAHSRSTLQVGGQGGVLNDYTANSTQITSSANILVERPMYFSY